MPEEYHDAVEALESRLAPYAKRSFEAFSPNFISGLAVHEYFAALPKSHDSVYLAWQPETWRLSMWGVVLESSGYQDPHIHPEGWLSGVYYVRVPKCIGRDEDDAGFLEFGRGKAALKTKDVSLIKRMQPREGQMVLFPSYYYHRTIPFESEEKRMCIAFDVRPVVN